MNKVDLKTAESEFERFAEAMDLDTDTVGMDSEDRNQFERQKKKVIRAMCAGNLIINEDGEAVYTPVNKNSATHEPLTFHERTGASLMASDGKKKGYDVTKTYAIMADMCQVPPQTFAGLAGSDIKVCEALFAFLMD